MSGFGADMRRVVGKTSAASQLAIDREVEHRQIPQTTVDLKLSTD
jgi:hypothetical protein